MCVNSWCQLILKYTKVTCEHWSPASTVTQHSTVNNNIGLVLFLIARQSHWWQCHCVSACVRKCAKNNRSGSDLMPQQENWAIKENPRTTRLPPVEKLCSCSRTSTACVCGKMHLCMFIRIPAHGMTSPCMWPLSVISDGCHSCFSFIYRQWEPVIRLGWAASHTVLQERPDDFFPPLSVRGIGATCPMLRERPTGDVTPAKLAVKHGIISVLTEDKEAGRYQVCFIILCACVLCIFAFGEWGWGPSFCPSVWTLYWLKSIITS